MTGATGEMWRAVPGSDGRYDVSSRGRIRSYLQAARGRFVKADVPQGFIKLQRDKNGYVQCALWYGGKHHTVKVHRLVARAFVREPRNGEEICHRNSVKDDNRVENLEWNTHYHNQVVYAIPSLYKAGADNPQANLTADIVRQVREMGQTGKHTHRQIAATLGLQRRNVGKILQGTRWAKVR